VQTSASPELIPLASIAIRHRPKTQQRASAPAIRLRHAQGCVFRDRHRFRILIAGRRFGKSFLAVAELLRGATERKGDYFYLAPTYRMAKEIAWILLKELTPKPWIKKKNESDLAIELVNGSRIELKGSENADALRGRSLCGAVLDESAYINDAVWQPVIRPALADKQGWCLFITTPPISGCTGWFWDLYQSIKHPDRVDETDLPANAGQWSLHEFTTLEGENVPAEEIDAARRELDPRTFRIEFEARFEALGGLVAATFSEENVRRVEDDTKLPLLIGADFNNDPLTTVLAVIRNNELHIFDELVLTGGATTWTLAEALNLKFGLEREKHCCPDPTGARQQTSGVGMSDHAILRRAGIKVFASKGWHNTKDKINAVNAAFMTADGIRHCFVHPRCKHLLKSLRTLGYAKGSDIPNKKSGVDHSFDSMGYLCLEKFYLLKPKQGGTAFRLW
jgi:hypothetical protein